MKTPRWNPYLVGALIGLLSVLTFSLANKPLGMSTGLAQAAGACAVQIYSAMVYQGLSLVPRIANGLDQLLAQDGHERLDQAIGTTTQDWL